jgi:hypothetical protein
VFLMLEKSPLETLATPEAAGAGRSVQVFQNCTPTEEGVPSACRAVVKICTYEDDVEDRPPIRCREAYPRRPDRIVEAA